MPKNSKRLGKAAEERVRRKFLFGWNLKPHCVVRNIASGTYEQEAGDLSFHLEKCGYLNPHLVVEVKRRKYIPIAMDSKMVRSFLSQVKKEAEKYQSIYGVAPSILLVLVKPYERDFVVYYKLSKESNLQVDSAFPRKGRTMLSIFLKKVKPVKIKE